MIKLTKEKFDDRVKQETKATKAHIADFMKKAYFGEKLRNLQTKSKSTFKQNKTYRGCKETK